MYIPLVSKNGQKNFYIRQNNREKNGTFAAENS